VPVVLKSGHLQLIDPSGPLQACTGVALLLLINIWYLDKDLSKNFEPPENPEYFSAKDAYNFRLTH